MQELLDLAVSMGLRLVRRDHFSSYRFFFGDDACYYLSRPADPYCFHNMGLSIAGGETLVVSRLAGGEWLISAADAPHLISTLGRNLPGRWGGNSSDTYAIPSARFLVPTSAANRIAANFAASDSRVDFGGSLRERPLARNAELIVAVVPGLDFAGVAVLQELEATEARLRRLAAEMSIPIYCCLEDDLPGDPGD